MKKIKYIVTLLLLFVTPFTFISCDMDPTKDGKLEEKDIWNNTKRAFGFLNNTYTSLLGGYNRIDNAMLASATDEAIHSNNSSNIYGFYDGRWSRHFLIENVWGRNYDGIRKANQFLENIESVPITESLQGTIEELTNTKERMIGEAYFLRALYHFELFKRYGAIPIVKRVLSREEAQAVTRATVEETINAIIEDCDVAVERLPKAYLGTIPGFDAKGDKGRATVGAAKALKAKALLYFASPLYNPSNEIGRWEKAADATKEVIDLNEYELLSLKSGESIDMIYYLVGGGTFGRYNRDVIFSTSYFNSRSVEQVNTPPSFGGYGLTNPTQNLVDAFGMSNGKPITDADSGYDPNDPYKDRDPRFYSTILCNNQEVKINDRVGSLETFEGGKDAEGAYKTATKTGYYLTKFLSKNAVWDGRTINIERTWVLMRYAEVLLNYAEALNEANGDPVEEVYTSLEAIRERAGLNPYEIERGKSQEEMRELIRNERRVELAFEEQRFFDVRRWRLFDNEDQRDDLLKIRGVKIEKNSENEFSYTEKDVEDRSFSERMYHYPIPHAELLRAPGIEQNPGW